MDPLISVCMIVKNEEAVLDRCLRSITNHVDEIVIVDTGSTDATKSIAFKYTNKVFDFKWINDFSAARNEAIKHATGKFILILDADEYMDESNLEALRSLLLKENPRPNTVYQLIVVSFREHNKPASEDPILRVFANGLGIRYIRPIHEQPAPAKGFPSVTKLPVRIYHSGYTEETIIAKNKHERNLSIFRTMQKKDRLSPYDECMLGRQLIMMEKPDEALVHLLNAMKNGDHKDEWYKHNQVSIMELYLSTNQLIDAYEFYRNHLIRYNDYPDIRNFYAITLQRLGFWAKAKITFEECYQLAEERASKGLSPALISSELAFRGPIWYLVTMLEREQQHAKAFPYILKLVQANARDLDAYGKMLELLALLDSSANVIRFLGEKFAAETDSFMNAISGKLSITLYNRDLARHYCESKLWSGLFNTGEQLRYALLTNQPDVFHKVLASLNNDTFIEYATAVRIATGIIAWERMDWMGLLISHSALHQFVQALFQSPSQPASMPSEHIAREILTELYQFQYWDQYENLLSFYDSPATINYLASFFLSKNHKDTALQYYQHLLDNQLMDVESFSNLGFYQYAQGSTDDALYLWDQAMQQAPNRPSLYIQCILAASDQETKETYKKSLLQSFPEYSRLSLLP